jgi:hypothetical protein
MDTDAGEGGSMIRDEIDAARDHQADRVRQLEDEVRSLEMLLIRCGTYLDHMPECSRREWRTMWGGPACDCGLMKLKRAIDEA